MSDTRVTIVAKPQLPPEFADLIPALDWASPNEAERYEKRMNSSMDELHAFYDLVCPRAADARDYLDKLDVNDLPVDAQHLLWLLFSLISVSYAVDVFNTPRVPDSGSAYVKRVSEPSTSPV